MKAVYDPFAPFYDVEYGGKTDDLPFYRKVAQEYGDPILETGVGTARVCIDLARRGHKIWGIDHSVRMLQYAEKKLQAQPDKVRENVRLIHADMRRFDLMMEFNLCIIPFRTFLHNLTLQQQSAALSCIHAHLKKDGILALDLFVPLHQVLQQSRWQMKIPADELSTPDDPVAVSVDIRHDPVKQILVIKNTYHQAGRRPMSGTMRYRYVGRYEMELLLRLAGFHIISCHGGFNGEPYDFHSGIMCFIAGKK